jgi:hypothetical protein
MGGGACNTHGEMKNAYKIVVGKPEDKRTLESRKRRWEDYINMDLAEIVWDGVQLSHLAQDRDRWRVLANMVMNLQVL